MAKKPTVASDWLCGCAGCHMSLLDMDERLVEIIQHVDLTATPITDLKQPPAAGVDVGVLEGAVNNSSNEEVAKRMRERCRVLVAMGDCAVFGGIPTMRNRGCKQAALRRAYVESESTVDGRVPDDPELAVMQEARPLDQVVEVDVYLPGCPPPADAIYLALKELAQGRMPELKGKDLDWH
ncbi:MAG TPA: NADP oxidoreductase [Phycisphaerae bacterium]|nr:NADP oxidoreductase [Phycisphaerae bacterium]HOJ56100.1 NADP oxidoreductase [Phycisphaerae bacterium]HOL25787.1 NADP oxidoreductase [Phycisphaerae bacterium]HPP19520.1 NADP oxidoreductase [Phycisphaerae bacterium]HPU32634.1 NADP oxidoreductase [Phycisphaerae bacterium]